MPILDKHPSQRNHAHGRAPITLAKLTRPRLVSVIVRERLLDCMDQRLSRPSTWIVGPPGSGKTTLLSSYIESRDRPVIWYQIDRDDSDVATFFHFLAIAIQHRAKVRRNAILPVLTPEYLPDLPAFTRRFFREAFSRLPENTILALDDYHELPLASSLHGVIVHALAQMPTDARMLVASRSAPPAEFARLVANQAITSVTWTDLKLTEPETVAIARTKNVTNAAIVGDAHRQSDGWVAGLILLLGQEPASAMKSASILAPSSPLFDYFAGVFIENIPAETREVLLRTAYLSRMSGPLAASLSGNPKADRLLGDLFADNSFIDRRGDTEPTFQVHALFREFLLRYLERHCTPTERTDRIRQTADALCALGQPEDAVPLYCDAGHWDKASATILGIAPQLFAQGRWHTLQVRISALPPGVQETTPWLQYWLGASQMAIDLGTAQRTLVHSFEGFVRSGDATGQMLAAAMVIESYYASYADFLPLDTWIEALERLLAKGAAFPERGMELLVYSNLVVALAFRAPWHERLNDYAGHLLEQVQSDADADANQRISAAGTLSWYFSWIGNLEAANLACAVARPLLADEAILPVRKAWVMTCMAFAAYMRADGDDGDALFAKAFVVTDKYGLGHIEFWMRVADCWRRLDRGEYRAVAATLKRHEATLVPSRRMDASHYYFIRGWLACLEGDLVLARQHEENALELASASGAVYGVCFNLLLHAVILVEQDEHAAADATIERFDAMFGPVHSAMFDYSALLVKAYCALRGGDPERTAKLLGQALAIGRTRGYLTSLHWNARMMSRLLGFALDRDIESEFAEVLIQRRRLVPSEPRESWPWAVKVYCLGRFEVMRQREVLRFEGKTQRKPLALLKLLIAFGVRDVPIDKLVAILWPDPLTDGQKAFEITVHRLRKLLGDDDVIQVTDRRVSLNPKLVWVDANALERRLTALGAALDAGDFERDEIAAVLKETLALYGGAFLDGEPDAAWQVSVRSRLAAQFQQFLLRLGEYWEERKEWSRAAELYQRGIVVDPLAESMYRRLMACLHALGQRAEAIEVYRRCRQALSITLGVAPTAVTEALYARIVSSGSV